jgi:hypothetical protein
MQRSTICGIHNSLICLHLVLSIPHDMGKQGIIYNNLSKSINIIKCFQSTKSYEGSNTTVNA